MKNGKDLLGSRFEDLTVKFYVGNQIYEGTVVPNRSRELGNNQFEVAVKVPNTVPLGASRIVLERKQNQIIDQSGTAPLYKEIHYDSNKIQLSQSPEYILAALEGADSVAILDGTNPKATVTAPQSNSSNLLLATIPVGTSDRIDRPRDLAVTSDGTRAYTVLEGSGRVALVDPMVLQQIDTQPLTNGVNPIELPLGAKPRSIVISPRDEYAYIADGERGEVYILDIDPFSTTYHQIINTITIDAAAPRGLRSLAISSDGRKLFVTAPGFPNSQIVVINIDPKDRPRDANQNPQHWHEMIGKVQVGAGSEGISATSDPLKMTYANSRGDNQGFGLLSVTNDDPKAFAAEVKEVPLGLGGFLDYFDVNEGVSVAITRDGSYGFVVGRNADTRFFGQEIESIDGVQAGSNIGIIKDPLTNPKLVAATRPIPDGFATDLVLSNDNKYLYASYPGLSGTGDVYVFDVEEMIKTLNQPEDYQIDNLDRGIKSVAFNANAARGASVDDLARVPIDDINPAISIAADYGILQEDRAANQFVYSAFPGSNQIPIGTKGSPGGLSAAPADWLDLMGPIGTSKNLANPLTPNFQWNFGNLPNQDVKEVNLFVSVFDEGNGLLPWDRVVDLSAPNGNEFLFNQGLSKPEQLDLLTKPWDISNYSKEDDFNPNRILTATWQRDDEDGIGKWTFDGGKTWTEGSNTSFTLPKNRTLTAGQEYNWAVEAWNSNGKQNIEFGNFWTPLPKALNGDDTFRSVTVLTHGFKPPFFSQPGIPGEFYEMADSIANAGIDGDGLIVRYDRSTGYWVPVNKYGQVLANFQAGLNPKTEPDYLTKLESYIAPYLEANKPLVILNDWSRDNESVVPDSGFTEAAADSFFASLVQLDGLFKDEGSSVKQGALFNSPLHFIGFSRGAVVNSEIIQRLGTYFPEAGGKENTGIRDLQMTTLDPHDFDQPGLNVITQNFGDFREPKVQVWDNVTFADNYYQTVPNLLGGTITPAGRDFPNLPFTEDGKTASGLQFPRQGWISENPDPNAPLLGEPDLSVFLGTNKDNPDYASSRAGFTRETDPAIVIAGRGAVHERVLSWYGGTTDLEAMSFPGSQESDANALFRRRGDGYYEHLFDQEFSFGNTASNPPRVSPWYRPEHTQARFQNGADDVPAEGIGTGWFYSVLGGGQELRPQTFVERIPVDWDNSYDARMRGDFAVPTLFNGNFDAVFNPQGGNRTIFSNAIPGWSFHNGGEANSVSTNNLVDWRTVPTLMNRPDGESSYLEKLGINPFASDYQPNYALRLQSGESMEHNRFVVPDWGTLRFNLHVPELSGGQLKVSIQGDAPGYKNYQPIGNIDLRVADGRVNPGATPEIAYPIGYADTDTNRIGYGNVGFETFHVDVPEVLRGKSAKLKFELEGNNTVYLDDIFFKSVHLKFGNPTLNEQEARPDAANNPNNYLIEKPQYSLSYNESNKGSNWVSWQLNKTWLGNLRAPEGGSAEPYDPFPWRSDSALPSELDTTEGWEYQLSGFDRGHLTAREHRNRTQKDQFATFLTTNLLPQEGEENQRGAWRQLEVFSKGIVEDRGWELYNIAGGYESYNDELPPDNPLNIENINVPELMWKVIVPLRPGQGIADVTANTPVIAVMLPNFATNPPGTMRTPWFDPTNITTVDRIEELTGLDLLSNLPDEIENILESRAYTGPVTVNNFPNVVT